jgi:hypothetical protein
VAPAQKAGRREGSEEGVSCGRRLLTFQKHLDASFWKQPAKAYQISTPDRQQFLLN